MKTISGKNALRVVVASLLLMSMPGLALASPIASRDLTTSDSAMITSSVVAATSDRESLAGSAVSTPNEKTPCAIEQSQAPAASDADDPVLEDARKGVDPWFPSND
jgi:hypothetical protein